MTPDEIHRSICDVLRLLSDGEVESEQGSAWVLDSDQSLEEMFVWLDDEAEKAEEFKGLLDFVFNSKLPMTSQLEAMLNSPERYTIGELCQYLVRDVSTPAVEPARILGNESYEATIFRILRRRLAEMGADVAGVKPSTRLEPFLQQHGERLWLFASRLAPGALAERVKPVSYVVARALERIAVALWVAGVVCIIAWGFNSFFGFVPLVVGVLGLAAIPLAMILTWLSSKTPARSYRWGEMKTFGDVCAALASAIRAQRA